MLNPMSQFPVDGPNYDGTAFTGSGLFTAKGTTFALTFTKAGTFGYVCVIHAPQGMFGTVTVTAAGAPGTPAQLPNTGGETTTLPPIGGGLLLLLGALTLRIWRRRAI